MPRPTPLPELPHRPGVRLSRSGAAEVAVYAENATAVWLCLFDDEGHERRVRLTERRFGWWYDTLDGIEVGQRYAFRADGPWVPNRGQRYAADKLLLDPYGEALAGEVTWGPQLFSHAVDDQLRPMPDHDPDARVRADSAGLMPRNVVISHDFDWGGDEPPAHPWSRTVIYETHVKSLTMTHPDVPPEHRGTYAGLTHPSVIDHLRGLGVNAVELLPIHAKTSEPRLVRAGLTNLWGYNSLSFFAPHPGYAAARTPQGVIDEFKAMVAALHAADIEVILDVVYNHSSEQGSDGATLSWRGVDNQGYYRLDDHGRNVDVTGCGNTFDARHPVVVAMMLDSLRYWVETMHVDGFRFDLAVALGRGDDGRFADNHPFLVGVRSDPVLSRVKLIAEPWDLGVDGWQTGHFPPPFSEWNDKFRDGARRFWLSDVGVARSHGSVAGPQLRELATRLSGSSDLFDHDDRGPTASINFVAAHDGFTLADLTAYNHKHNDANGENNTDGTDANLSFNFGVEGATDDPEIAADRRRAQRNLLATLTLSIGVPMINGGDELGRSQGGNNNAYCQDNETSWFDWSRWRQESWRDDLLATATYLLQLRRDEPALRANKFRTMEPAPGSIVANWYASDGQEMGYRWDTIDNHTFQMLLHDGVRDPLLIICCGSPRPVQVTLPTVATINGYAPMWDSTWERPREASDQQDPPRSGPIAVGRESLVILRGIPA